MAATANKGGRATASSRSDLVEKIADQCGLTQTKAEEVTRAYEDAIKQALASGGEVRLAGFGTFKVTQRAARIGRNPQTGESLKIAAQTTPRFTAGKQFKEQVGGPKGGSKGGAKGGAAKAGAAKAGSSKSGGAAKGGASKGGASKGGSKSGAAKGGASKGSSKGGAAKK